MPNRILNLAQSVMLDGAGDGSTAFRANGETWTIDFTSVACSPRTIEARAYVYKNYIGDAYLLDNTLTGSTGDTTDTTYLLTDGESLIVVWTGGNPGATATATIRGSADNNTLGGFRAIP